jgi:hypothetical protein
MVSLDYTMSKQAQHEKIKRVVAFLYRNVDFFADCFQNPRQFQMWAAKRPCILSLSNDLNDAFKNYKDVAGLRIAICGNIGTQSTPHLLGGNKEAIIEYLRHYEDVLNALYKNIRHHDIHSAIRTWYKEKATQEQKERRIKKTSSAIKESVEVTSEYKQHLKTAIEDEVFFNMSAETLKSLCLAFRMPYNMAKKDKHPLALQKNIINSLLDKYSKPSVVNDQREREIAQALNKKNNQLIKALKKYQVISIAKKNLKKSCNDKGTTASAINQFRNYLHENRNTLTVRRDSIRMTRFKRVCTSAATLLGPIGGYVAYHRLFGSRATEGHEYLNKVDKIALSFLQNSKPKAA